MSVIFAPTETGGETVGAGVGLIVAVGLGVGDVEGEGEGEGVGLVFVSVDGLGDVDTIWILSGACMGSQPLAKRISATAPVPSVAALSPDGFHVLLISFTP